MKKNLKKLLTIAAASTLLSASALISHADWKQDHVGWWYQNTDGTYLANGWHWIDGNKDGISECYYFDESGYCLINTATPDGYVVDANGAWIVDGVVQTKAAAVTPPAENITSTYDEWEHPYDFVCGMTQDDSLEYKYVVNVNTGKVHTPGCRSVKTIYDENKWYFNGSFSSLTASSYVSCKICNAH